MSQNKTKKQARRRRQQASWPLILLVVVGVIFVFGAFYALRQLSQPKGAIETSGGPSLRVDQELVDLGDVQLGQTVQVAFQVTNSGDQPLRFEKAPFIEVKEGC